LSNAKIPTDEYSNLGGINNKVSPYKNDLTECRDIRNMDFREPNALTKRDGSSLYVGATVSGRITSMYEFQKLSGASYLVAVANTNAYTVDTTFTAFASNLTQNTLWDFVTFVDRLFMCNGVDNVMVFDGSNTTRYTLPPGNSGWGATVILDGGSYGVGTYVLNFGYVNNRNYFGPVSFGITLTVPNGSFVGFNYYGMSTPGGFGITALALYRSEIGGIIPTFTTYAIGSSVIDIRSPLTTRLGNNNVFLTNIPFFMDLYNNQLFSIGFSAFASTYVWSDIGLPDSINPNYSNEFRTNDGDVLTGSRVYQNSMFVFKNRSFGAVTGTDPNNLLQDEVSNEYGALSNRCIQVFNNRMVFLSEKGLVEYNGANLDEMFSEKIKDIFELMNIQAAKQNAVSIHLKNVNQVWFSFPYNGATTNNITVVYDYLVKAWTVFDGFQLSTGIYGRGNIPAQTQRVIYGGYTGNIFAFDSTLTGDNGNAISCAISSAFLTQRGNTVETQYRRFYLNVNPIGFTQPITLDFKTNYGASVVLSRTIYQNPYQTRVEFGLPARSLQANIYHVSASTALTVYGWAISGRFQRDV